MQLWQLETLYDCLVCRPGYSSCMRSGQIGAGVLWLTCIFAEMETLANWSARLTVVPILYLQYYRRVNSD